MHISLVVGFSGLILVAQFGFSSVIMYLIVMLLLFIPSSIVISELNARLPEEEGFYNWVKQAFADIHAFIVAWSYWLISIVWFPFFSLHLKLEQL